MSDDDQKLKIEEQNAEVLGENAEDIPTPETVIASESEDERGNLPSQEDPHVADESAPQDDTNENDSADSSEEAVTVIPSEAEESLTNVSAEEPASAGDPSPAEPVQDDKNETAEVPDDAEPSNEDGETAEEPIPDDSNPDAKWYVVHTYSGHENKVAATLKQRIEAEHFEDRIIDVLVPTQDKIEIKGGKKTSVKEKIFPGYILVRMVLDDNTWAAVRTTQGVTSFVGIGNKPTPIPASEVASIVRFTQIQQPTFKQIFEANDTVKIVDGPFAEFIGKVESVDSEKGKVRVLVSIFGRETPVELDFLQVQKI